MSPIRALASLALAMTASLGIVSSAQAAPTTIQYRCLWPFAGAVTMPVTIDAGIPTSFVPGRSSGVTPVDVRATMPGGLFDRKLPGYLSGRLVASVRATGGGLDTTASLSTSIPRANLLAVRDTVFEASGTFGALTFPSAGTAALSLESLRFVFDSLLAEEELIDIPQTDSNPNTFEVPCTPVSSPASLASRPIAPATDSTAPAAPGIASSTFKNYDTTRLTWAKSSDADVVAYEVSYKGPNPLAPLVEQTRVVVGNTVRLGGPGGDLVYGGNYEVTVRARDGAGNLSAPSQPYLLVMRAPAPYPGEFGPAAPSIQLESYLNPDAKVTDTTIMMSYGSPGDDTGIRYFELYRDGLKIETLQPFLGSSYVFEGLSPSTSYRFEVSATDLDGNVEWSKPTYASTGRVGGGAIPYFDSYIQFPTVTKTSAEMKWLAAKPRDDDKLSYEVLLEGKVVGSTSTLSYTFTNLSPGVIYNAAVRAKDPAGNLSETIATQFRTKAEVIPTPKPVPVQPVPTDPVPAPKTVDYLCYSPGYTGGSGGPVKIEYSAVQRGTSPRWDVTATMAAPEGWNVLVFGGVDSFSGSIKATTEFWSGNTRKSVPVRFGVPKQRLGQNFASNSVSVGPISLGDGPVAWTADTIEINVGFYTLFGLPYPVNSDYDSDGNPFTLDLLCRQPSDSADMRIKQLTVSGGGSVVTESTATGPTPVPTPSPTPTPKPTPAPTPTPTPVGPPTPVPTPTPTPIPTPTPTPTPVGPPTPVPTPTPTPTPTPVPTPTPTSGSIRYGYAITGSSAVKTLTKGSLPLSGSVTLDVALPSGLFTGELSLDQASAKLTALGFLPVDAKVVMNPTERTTGSIRAGKLTSVTKVRIKLPSVKTLGIELAGGANCQAKQISSITLVSTQPVFDPLNGGPLAGTFSISDLSGCGFLTGIVSPLTKGDGNAIALNLTVR